MIPISDVVGAPNKLAALRTKKAKAPLINCSISKRTQLWFVAADSHLTADALSVWAVSVGDKIGR